MLSAGSAPCLVRGYRPRSVLALDRSETTWMWPPARGGHYPGRALSMSAQRRRCRRRPEC